MARMLASAHIDVKHTIKNTRGNLLGEKVHFAASRPGKFGRDLFLDTPYRAGIQSWPIARQNGSVRKLARTDFFLRLSGRSYRKAPHDSESQKRVVPFGAAGNFKDPELSLHPGLEGR